METKNQESIKKGVTTMSETKLINNFDLIIYCEHCEVATTHEQLGENGTCPSCKKEVRKGLM